MGASALGGIVQRIRSAGTAGLEPTLAKRVRTVNLVSTLFWVFDADRQRSASVGPLEAPS